MTPRLPWPSSIPGIVSSPRVGGGPLVIDADGNVRLNYGSGVPGDGLGMHWWDRWSAAGGPDGDGCYPQGAVVLDYPWLTIANKDTCDRPAPQDDGPPVWATGLGDTPAWTDQVEIASQGIFGFRFTAPDPFYGLTFRFWGITGQRYTLFTVTEPLSATPDIRWEPPIVASADGWIEIPIGTTLILTGRTYDVGVAVAPGAPVTTTFAGDWDYKQTDGNANDGEIWHGGAGNARMTVAALDADDVDRTTDLNTLVPGSGILASGQLWEITEVIGWAGGALDLRVTPTSRLDENQYNFTFSVTNPESIEYVEITNGWSSLPNVQGFKSFTGYANIVLDEDIYGVDLFIQFVTASEDWDYMAGISGGGGGGGLTEGEADGIYLRRDGGNTMLGDLYFGAYGNIGFDENNQGVSLNLGQTIGASDSVTPFLDFYTGNSVLAARLIANATGLYLESRVPGREIQLRVADGGGAVRARFTVDGDGDIFFFDQASAQAGRLNASLVRFGGIYASTVTFSPNVYVDATGRLFRSTSSADVKENIRPLPLAVARLILNTTPSVFDGFATDHDPVTGELLNKWQISEDQIGPIAQDFIDAFSDLIEPGPLVDGYELIGVSVQGQVTAMLRVLQDIDERLASLEARFDEHESLPPGRGHNR